MKLRNGFVSNSSSSSFILIAKDDNLKTGFYRKKDRDCERFLHIDLDKAAGYNRGYIKEIKSVKDKLTYICAMYLCNYYNVTDENLFEVEKAFKKIKSACKKYGYEVWISNPKLGWNMSNKKWNEQTKDFDDAEPFIEYYFNIGTECCYYPDIKKMVDDDDTTRLEHFLFNPHSFGILGGDEYKKTYVLAHKARQRVDKLGYEYERLADYPDVHYKKGDPIPWSSRNEVFEEDYDNEWGDYDPADWEDDR